MVSEARLTQLRAVSACLGNRGTQEAPVDTHAALGTRQQAPGAAQGLRLRSGHQPQLGQCPRAGPERLGRVVAPTVDASVHQPCPQLPVLPAPTLCPGADPPLPSRSEARPPSAPSSASTAQGSSTAAGTMEATSPPGSRPGSRDRPRPGGRRL